MSPSPSRWLAGAAWLTVMGAIAALWAFPDAMSQLRQRTTSYATPAACDLAAGPCVATFDDGHQTTLSVRPAPFRASRPLEWEVRTDGPPPLAIELQGVDMNMGLVRIPLVAGPDGRFTATAALPACTSDRMRWRADVVAPDRTAGFELDSVQLGPGHAGSPGPVIGSGSGVAPSYRPFEVTTSSGPVLAGAPGRATVVYFGFLSCPDVCPTTLATLARALDGLDAPDRPQVVFVTVDPERDTPERMSAYAHHFAPDFVGGAVADGHLPAIAAEWGVVYRRVDLPGSALGYTMDHSTQATLVGGDGTMRQVLPHGTPASEIRAAVLAAGE